MVAGRPRNNHPLGEATSSLRALRVKRFELNVCTSNIRLLQARHGISKN
jgi:hypothetical protein